MRPSLAANYSGWETSLQMLVQKVKELKPDGLLGRKLPSQIGLQIPALPGMLIWVYVCHSYGTGQKIHFDWLCRA